MFKEQKLVISGVECQQRILEHLQNIYRILVNKVNGALDSWCRLSVFVCVLRNEITNHKSGVCCGATLGLTTVC